MKCLLTKLDPCVGPRIMKLNPPNVQHAFRSEILEGKEGIRIPKISDESATY